MTVNYSSTAASIKAKAQATTICTSNNKAVACISYCLYSNNAPMLIKLTIFWKFYNLLLAKPLKHLLLKLCQTITWWAILINKSHCWLKVAVEKKQIKLAYFYQCFFQLSNNFYLMKLLMHRLLENWLSCAFVFKVRQIKMFTSKICLWVLISG